jgi:hypothetical protein
MRDLIFFKKNLERLKSFSLDCPICIQDRVMCRHYDDLRNYIKELEALPPVDEEKFAKFWKEYPRKVSRKMSLKAWLKIKMTDELFHRIMGALHNHKVSVQWEQNGGKFIPHPTTWLNQERWDDEIGGKKVLSPKEKEQKEKERYKFYMENGYWQISDD